MSLSKTWDRAPSWLSVLEQRIQDDLGSVNVCHIQLFIERFLPRVLLECVKAMKWDTSVQ